MDRKRKRKIRENIIEFPSQEAGEANFEEEEAWEDAEEAGDAKPVRGFASLFQILRERDEPAEDEEAWVEADEEEELPVEAPHGKDKLANLIGICIFLVLLAVALGMIYFVMRIDTILIYGNDTVPTETVTELMNITAGQHMWLIDTNAAEARLKTNSYITEAKITRIYPSTLRVDITERKEAAAVVGLGTAAVVDAKGYVLSIGTRGDYTGLLKIYGAGSAGYQVNQRLGEESDFTSRTLVAIIAAITEADMLDVIESVDISNALSVYMTTFSGITVQIGQAENLDTKLKDLRDILPEIQSMGYTNGTVYFPGHGAPVFSPPAEVGGETGDTGEESGDDDAGSPN